MRLTLAAVMLTVLANAVRVDSSRSACNAVRPTRPVAATAPRASAQLAIHHINVQQGDCTFIVGPNGTTVLIDGGNQGKGTAEVVPYLQSIGHQPAAGLDFMIATHRDGDHLGGLDEVIEAGYDVRRAVWDNGSTKTNGPIDEFVAAAKNKTTAGEPESRVLNQKESAAYLGVTTETIRTWVGVGRLAAPREVGRKKVWTIAQLDAAARRA